MNPLIYTCENKILAFASKNIPPRGTFSPSVTQQPGSGAWFRQSRRDPRSAPRGSSGRTGHSPGWGLGAPGGCDGSRAAAVAPCAAKPRAPCPRKALCGTCAAARAPRRAGTVLRLHRPAPQSLSHGDVFIGSTVTTRNGR